MVQGWGWAIQTWLCPPANSNVYIHQMVKYKFLIEAPRKSGHLTSESHLWGIQGKVAQNTKYAQHYPTTHLHFHFMHKNTSGSKR